MRPGTPVSSCFSDRWPEQGDPGSVEGPCGQAGVGRSPDGAGWGRDGADQAAEIRLRNVNLQRGDLWVEGPEGRCRGLFLTVQRCELDLYGRAGESKSAPATRGRAHISAGETGVRPRGSRGLFWFTTTVGLV